ncbi:phosphodiester glycosidase family protein [Rhizobium sp. BR 314]|uniref:phosphodiester glycosidase family protein n=1 Tax=Rhizobium sp. BR 314 TaxID=3040013 RepID=UPI0039BEF208
MCLIRLMMILAVLVCAGVAAAGEPCRKVQHLGEGYTVCIFDPAVDDIQLFQNDRSGRPYGSFRALENDLRQDRIYVRFAMNGGMYLDDQSPVGLFIENGRELKAINTNKGWGNFHLLPNGIFYLLPGRAGIMESKAFAASGIKPFYATQSGPMLVIGGQLHPSFLADSTSLKTRNGVGVAKDGKVVFAISDGPVRFHDLATLFRDDLGCANALFLDGSISSLDIPEWQRRDGLFPLGPIIAVTEMLPG